MRSALLGAAVGAAGVTGALTFAASLDALVEEPARWGWNWTISPDIEGDDLDAVGDISGIDDVGQLIHRQVVVEGEQLLAVGVTQQRGTPSLTVVRGRMPNGPGEIALGPKLADRADVDIGGVMTVEDNIDSGVREMEVVGEVLFPTFDDNLFNDGVAVDADAIDQLARSEGFEQTVVGFDGSVSADEAASRLEEAAPGSVSPYAYASPPPDVANLDGVRFLPPALALFLGLLALAAITHALATSVQHRRHDLGIVRSLGFVGTDVIRAITAQSTTLVVVGLLIGLPVGVIAGRVAWGLVAGGLGVVVQPYVPAIALGALVLGALLAGVLLAVVPGRAAARQPVAASLRAE